MAVSVWLVFARTAYATFFSSLSIEFNCKANRTRHVKQNTLLQGMQPHLTRLSTCCSKSSLTRLPGVPALDPSLSWLNQRARSVSRSFCFFTSAAICPLMSSSKMSVIFSENKRNIIRVTNHCNQANIMLLPLKEFTCHKYKWHYCNFSPPPTSSK